MHELAKATGVDHRLGQRVRELSGGERQRGALVRSLMNDPEMLLCDEPTGALDESNREKVFDLLLELVRSRGRTLVLATHDPELAGRCDRTVRMRDGRIEGGDRMMTEPSRPRPEAAGGRAPRCGMRWAGWCLAMRWGFICRCCLLAPDLQLAEWTYGRWVPVHLNVQLYGWTSLPLVAWLFSIYEVDRSKARRLGTRRGVGVDRGAGRRRVSLARRRRLPEKSSSIGRAARLWGFVAAQVLLWVVLAAAWRERSGAWSKSDGVRLAGRIGRAGAGAGVAGLRRIARRLSAGGPHDRRPDGLQPVRFIADRGGPDAVAAAGGGGFDRHARNTRGIWIFFAALMAGVRRDRSASAARTSTPHQIGAMLLLLPWVWWLPRDWAGFDWPEGSASWRGAMFGWWGLLVVSGVLMYQPGVLDRSEVHPGAGGALASGDGGIHHLVLRAAAGAADAAGASAEPGRWRCGTRRRW